MSTLQGRCLLVVDDNVDLRESMADYFKRLGAKVLEAGQGAEALALLERENVDALITDVKMPVMDGLELVQRLRGSSWPQPKVVVMSGYYDQLDPEAMTRLKVDLVLSKPFYPRDLQARLEGML